MSNVHHATVVAVEDPTKSYWSTHFSNFEWSKAIFGKMKQAFRKVSHSLKREAHVQESPTHYGYDRKQGWKDKYKDIRAFRPTKEIMKFREKDTKYQIWGGC